MDADIAKAITGILLGVGLSAACGFRVFVPLLFVSIASRAGYVTPAGGWEWLGSVTAIVVFGTATLLEIGAYYIPWLDNLLDTVATPAAIVAGVVVTACFVGGMHPVLKWSLAVIAGGGAAGAVQITTTLARAASTATTGGVANPAVSTAEAGASIGLSLLAIFIPILAAIIVVGIFFLIVRFFYRRFRRRPHVKA